jgi:hypothetical protein
MVCGRRHDVLSMSEGWRPSQLFASFLAFIAFIGSFITLALMFVTGAALPGYARGNLSADEHVREFEHLLVSVAAIFGLAFALFVYRIARHRISASVVFHVCFFVGMAMLGYCLWAVLTLFPIVDTSVVYDWSAHILQATFTGPLVCIFVIPVALFFLAFATLFDNRRND